MTLLFWSSGPGKGIASESTVRFNAEGRAENGEIGWRTKKKKQNKTGNPPAGMQEPLPGELQRLSQISGFSSVHFRLQAQNGRQF